MYTGVRVKKLSALLYTTTFCVRRMGLVLAFVFLQENTFWLMVAFNGLQSLYLWYIAMCKPHEEVIHNGLEIFNELCLITMQYFIIFYIGGLYVEPEA